MSTRKMIAKIKAGRVKLPIIRIMEAVMSTPWLITAGGFQAILGVLESKLASDGYVFNIDGYKVKLTHVNGAKKDDEDDSEDDEDDEDSEDDYKDDDKNKDDAKAQEESLRRGSPVNPKPKLVDDNRISVVPISGVLGQRLSGIEKMCGGCDYLDVQRATAERLDAGAKGILYAFDSPGGQVRGCPELAEYISGLNEKGIRTEAFTDSRMCSAAYWLASACDHITSSPSADVGSIGVILPWVDKSKVWEVEGLKWEPIVNEGATLKGTGGGPTLSVEQLSYLQETVNYVGKEFQSFVTDHREDVESKVFKAGTYYGRQAAKVGLVDDVGTYKKSYDNLLERVRTKTPSVPVTILEPGKEVNIKGNDMTEEEKAAFRAAERKAERDRLQALDKLAYTPECKALVDKAKEDGRTAADIGLEIAEMLNQDRQLTNTRAGIRQGAKAGTEIHNLDPNGPGGSDSARDNSPEALSKRLVGVFSKRHPEMRRQNQNLN